MIFHSEYCIFSISKVSYICKLNDWRYLIENIRKDFRLHDFQKEKETATIRNAMHSGQLQISNAPT